MSGSAGPSVQRHRAIGGNGGCPVRQTPTTLQYSSFYRWEASCRHRGNEQPESRPETSDSRDEIAQNCSVAKRIHHSTLLVREMGGPRAARRAAMAVSGLPERLDESLEADELAKTEADEKVERNRRDDQNVSSQLAIMTNHT